jgi:hypothetical protein
MTHGTLYNGVKLTIGTLGTCISAILNEINRFCSGAD